MLNSLIFTSLSLCRISGEVWCSAYLHVISTAVLLPIPTAQEHVLLSSGFGQLIYFCNPYCSSFELPEQFSEIKDCNVQSNSTGFSFQFLKFCSSSLSNNWGWETCRCAGYMAATRKITRHRVMIWHAATATKNESVLCDSWMYFCEKLSDPIQSRFLATSFFSTRSTNGGSLPCDLEKESTQQCWKKPNDEAIASIARLSLHRWVKQAKRWRAVQEVL